jgi:hypothetical protein
MFIQSCSVAFCVFEKIKKYASIALAKKKSFGAFGWSTPARVYK